MYTVKAQTLYVNVYEETQRYGGAEEGGWYYWEGTPIWTAKGICLCLYSKYEVHYPIGEYVLYGEHEVHCPIGEYILTAQAIVSGRKEGYLESYTSQDVDSPEYRNEGIYGRRKLRVEDGPSEAYPKERPYYE